jgi:integral membrane sensor domain MASE1
VANDRPGRERKSGNKLARSRRVVQDSAAVSRPANQVSAMYRPARDLGFILGIAALFAAAAWLGIALKRELGPVAAIWPSNGLLAAILLLRSQSDWRWTLAACFVANIAVNALAGNTADTAIGFSLANAVEVLIVVRVLRSSLTSMSALGDPRVLLRFFFYAVVIAPAVAAALATLVLHATVAHPRSYRGGLRTRSASL